MTTITLYHVKLPMKFNFKTAKSELNVRETIIIKAEDAGFSGFGECVAFTTPFYTDETLEIAWTNLIASKSSPMADAGLENALLDLKYKKKGTNLISGFFNEKPAQKIQRGAVLGEMPLHEIEQSILKLKNEGVQRIKLKISSQTDLKNLKTLLQKFPKLTFFADANQSFSDWHALEKLDELGLACIEEPLANLSDYQKLKLKTPICFDENVQSLADLKIVQKLVPNAWLNIKIGRLGGLAKTREILYYCRKQGIPFWVGSMVESGISKILHAQLSALAGNVMPGDLSSSAHYFERDLIEPELVFKQGVMEIPTAPGLGVAVNKVLLEDLSVRKESFDL